MANGDEAYVLAGKEDLGSDLEHTSDTSEPEIMSEPEIINESNGENGGLKFGSFILRLFILYFQPKCNIINLR